MQSPEVMLKFATILYTLTSFMYTQDLPSATQVALDDGVTHEI